ncbi:OmpA family protein [Erythrobacter sp. EC-HK427]|uniref:OmpA family protein n=1 Tax=Erythrobacter sp. EC-HK427 TaxID=2038396 RepID=UPI001251A9A6|nr:OmpA family protein [Erythrobacter sp. EC-HK427]VVS98054.1 conserved exported hypothetical protein [Erythrobacter sp. EC-HK427]
MTGFGKFLVGAAATSLLAWGAHAMTGAEYIDGLESSAQSTLDGLGLPDGATLAMKRDPLARVAVISGVTDPAERERIRAALLAIPGMGGVEFTDAADGSGEAAPAADAGEATESAEVVACQSDIDAVMAGKVINFQSGSAYMPDSSLAVVAEVAEALGNCPDLAVAIEGHTDATGSPAVNQTLSQARADAVAAALTERGIAAARISATGKGSSEPVMEGASAEANAANRRIEFDISGGTAPATPAEGE